MNDHLPSARALYRNSILIELALLFLCMYLHLAFDLMKESLAFSQEHWQT
jgi:hypothetical protein